MLITFSKKRSPMTKLVGCTTDGTPAMLGRKYGFQARVKAVCHFRSVCHSVHCFLHQFALAAKFLPPGIKTSLNLVVKMINYIKTYAFVALGQRPCYLSCHCKYCDVTVDWITRCSSQHVTAEKGRSSRIIRCQ